MSTRKDWLKTEVQRIKAGGEPIRRCIMSTWERFALGICQGDISPDRVRRGYMTCSAECQADHKRILRELNAQKKCRFCGHGLTKKQRLELKSNGYKVSGNRKEESNGTGTAVRTEIDPPERSGEAGVGSDSSGDGLSVGTSAGDASGSAS